MFAGIRRWWQAHQKVPAHATSPAQISARPEKKDDEAAELAVRLLELCNGQEAVGAGRMHIINFARLRHRLQKKWLVISDNVQRLIRRTIQSRLGPGEIHYELEPLLHVLILPGLNADEAALKCAVIVREIMGGLFGDEDGNEGATLESATISPSGAMERERVEPGKIVLAALERQINQRPVSLEHSPDSQRSPTKSIIQPAPEKQKPSRPSEAAYQDDRYALSRLLGDTGQALVDWRRILPIESRPMFNGSGPTEQSVPSAKVDPPPPPKRGLKFPRDAQIEFRFRPIWYVPRKMVTTYQARMVIKSALGEMTIDDVLGDDSAVETEFNTDLLLLKHALSTLASLKVAGKRAIVSTTVHARTLADRTSRGRLLALLDEAPDALRKFLVIDIAGLTRCEPALFPDWAAALRQRSRAVNACLPLNRRIPEPILQSKVFAVGGSLDDVGWSDAEIISSLPTFAAQAKSGHRSTFIYGVNNKCEVMAAVYAGFDYLAGDAVVAECALIDDIKPFRPIDLYLPEIGAPPFVP